LKIDLFADKVMDLIVAAVRIGKKRTYIKKCGMISAADAQILALVAAAGAVRMSEITGAMMTSKSASTQLVDKLIAGSYVSRADAARDRRVVEIMVTEKGKHVLAEYFKCRATLIDSILKHISPTEKLYPAVMLNKLTAGMKQYIRETNKAEEVE
jgi:DNA-binding MarR family transcriptional regulator